MTTSTFRETVALVAAKAILPQAVNGRVESAARLVLLHDVTPQEDGSILVGSSSDPMKTYRLEGHNCTCQDFVHGQAPEGWCQHRIAANLQRSVERVLARSTVALPCEPFPDNDPGPVEELPPTPAVEPTTPTPAPLPEAAFSLTLKGTLDGVEALLTARGQTADEFKRNLDAIRGLLDARPEPAQAPTGQGEGWCSKHGLQMTQTHKDGRSWYSHRTPDGQWCKGR